MTAIEKGTPLSEIMPPKPRPAGPAWIKYVSTGIALLIIGLGFVLGGLGTGGEIGILIFFVLGGVGAAMLIRGLLHRKYYLKNGNSAENNSTEKEKSA
jgi:multisubunit Na+/H+ antiporter MnhG subunit